MEVDRLELVVETEIDKANASLDALASKLTAVGKGLNGLMQSTQTASKTSQSAYASVASGQAKTGKSSRSLITQIGNIAFAFMSLRTVGKGVMSAINSSMDFGETINLFQTTFRKIGLDAGEEFENAFLERAQTFNDKITTALGLDPDEIMNYQARFAQMSNSMGLVAESAYNISSAFTMLGADAASLFNIDIDKSMQKLQSGLAGQIRPLRELGVDISKTALMQTAWNYGITDSIEKMSASAKVQLRFITTMQQLRVVMGDMAKTIESPANQMRVLRQQTDLLKRSIGNTFLPLITKILPYLNGIVIALRTIIQEVAAFLGFELPDWTDSEIYTGIPDLAADLEDAGDAADTATNAIKKLKRATIGMDELNVLSFGNKAEDNDEKDTPLNSGYAVLDKAIAAEYEAYTKKFNDELAEMQNKAQEFADEILPRIKDIFKIATDIGMAILGWKIASKFTSNLQTLGGIALTAAGAFELISSTVDAWKNGLSENNIDGMLLGTTALVGGLGMAFGPVGAAIGAAVGAVAMFASGLRDLFTNGLNEKNIAVLATVAGIVTVLFMFNPIAGVLAGVALAITGVAVAMTTDAVPAIEVFDDSISDLTRQKCEPFIEQIRALDDTVTSLNWTGKIIDQSVIDDVGQKVHAIVTTITAELDADKNEALSTLEPLKKALGKEAYDKLLSANEKYYAEANKRVTDGEKKINDIMAQAKAENRALTEEEAQQINQIQADMQDLGIQHLAESEVEYNTIMNRLKDNSTRISLEQASEIIKNAQNTRDEAVAAAETQYSKIELEAGRMRDAGIITQEEYDSMITAAKDTKDSTIKDANEQFTTIKDTAETKLGETAKYIDTETGDLKSKWTVFWEETGRGWSEMWDNLGANAHKKCEELRENISIAVEGIKTKWKGFVENLSVKWDSMWSGIKDGARNALESVKTTISNALENIKRNVIGFLNNQIGKIEGFINSAIAGLNHLIKKVNDATSKAGGLLEKLQIPLIPGISLPRFATGGFPEDGLFMANHNELIGRFSNGKTAVANNEQIIEGIRRGVFDGVKSAMAGNSDGGGNWVIQIIAPDGSVKAEEEISKIDRMNKREGKTIIPLGI